VLVDFVKPYKRLTLSAAAARINSNKSETEKLFIRLIMEGRMNATLDQLTEIVTLEPKTVESDEFEAMTSWADSIERVCTSFIV
jgi:hypothetical protein